MEHTRYISMGVGKRDKGRKATTERWGIKPITVAFPLAQLIKTLPAVQKMQEMGVRSLGQEDTLEEGMATHSGILA